MISSLANKPCHVPLMNFLIKISSIVVSEQFRDSSARLPEKLTTNY